MLFGRKYLDELSAAAQKPGVYKDQNVYIHKMQIRTGVYKDQNVYIHNMQIRTGVYKDQVT